MDKHSLDDIAARVQEWILEAGDELRESINSDPKVEFKTSSRDLVTEKDREIENYFISKINQFYPDHHIVGEEGTFKQKLEAPRSSWVWFIDPIDGTTNFVHQKQNFCISVALYHQGEPRLGFVYNPVTDELFRASKGQGAYLNDQRLPVLEETRAEEALIGLNSLWLTPNQYYDYQSLHRLVRRVRGSRSLGAAALEIAYVACGRLDAYIALSLSPWDFAAGLLIAQEVGASTSTIDQKPIDVFGRSSVLVSRPGLDEMIREVLDPALSGKGRL